MTAPIEASGRARRENNSTTEPRGPRLAASWSKGGKSAKAIGRACIERCLRSYHGLYVFDPALPFMIPTPLELANTHGHGKDQHRTADGGQNGDDGVQGDAIW
jgi:hypothetical protein